MSTVMGQTASVSVEIGGKEITIETGKLAKQADGRWMIGHVLWQSPPPSR